MRKNYYKFMGGKYLPERLDEIGEGIDFLILDTVHSMPGELLDFLAAFPFLKEGAIVVLHDIFLNQHARSSNAFATRMLFLAVVGEKIVGRGSDNAYNYIELGAFRITQDTAKYIENVFSALMVTWNYIPDSQMMELYSNFFLKYYAKDLLEEWNMAAEINCNALCEKKRLDRVSIHSMHELIKKIENEEKIFIYGCGNIGKESEKSTRKSSARALDFYQ